MDDLSGESRRRPVLPTVVRPTLLASDVPEAVVVHAIPLAPVGSSSELPSQYTFPLTPADLPPLRVPLSTVRPVPGSPRGSAARPRSVPPQPLLMQDPERMDQLRVVDQLRVMFCIVIMYLVVEKILDVLSKIED